MHDIADPAQHGKLWLRARSMCARAIHAIGEPATLAGRGPLTHETRYDIAAWLARLESVVRKLLLAAAAALVSEARAKAKKDTGPKLVRIPLTGMYAPPLPEKPPKTERGPRQLDLARPDTWPARFALAPPRDPYRLPDARAPRILDLSRPLPKPPPKPAPRPRRIVESALRFAFRLEALKRVLKDPLPYAERLARIMIRLIRRYPRAADRYAVAPYRPCVADDGDPRLTIDAIAAALCGAPILKPDTS